MADAMEMRLVELDTWAEYEREVWKQEGFTTGQIAEIERQNRQPARFDPKVLAAIHARQIVTEFHNRHSGLTCRLAYRLARVLQRPTQVDEATTPWREVLVRLNNELVPKDSLLARTGQPVQTMGAVLLNEAPIYSVYRLVLPLIQMACDEIGKCFLATEGIAIEPHYTVGDLIGYEDALIGKLIEFAKNRQKNELNLFWIDRAFTLSTYSRRSNLLQLLPDPDASSAAIFYRLDELPETLREYETLQRVPIRFRQQRSRRLREEGLSGISLSRTLEDVDRLLLSELMYPPLLRADRLLNTGYLVTERRPKQEKLRDVLFVGFLPPHTGELVSRVFIKTCWFNTIMVLAQVLFRHRLFDSEFWWVEGDDLERYSTTMFPLNHLKTALKTRNQVQVIGHSQFRGMFVNLTRWQPGFLDPEKPWLGGLESQPMPQTNEINGQRYAHLSDTNNLPLRWILSTANIQHRATSSYWEGSKSTQVPSSLPSHTFTEMISRFSMVHFMPFLPIQMLAEEDDPWGQEIEALLKFDLKLLSSPLHNLSITWMAASEQSQKRHLPPVVSYVGRFLRKKYEWDAAIPVGDLRTLASKLEKTWLDEFFLELQSEF